MSELSLDEIIEYVSRIREGGERDPEIESGFTGLIERTFDVGTNVLKDVSPDKIAGMISLAQTMLQIRAMEESNLKLVMLTTNDEFFDAVTYLFHAIAGILAMEEVH